MEDCVARLVPSHAGHFAKFYVLTKTLLALAGVKFSLVDLEMFLSVVFDWVWALCGRV